VAVDLPQLDLTERDEPVPDHQRSVLRTEGGLRLGAPEKFPIEILERVRRPQSVARPRCCGS
jgi:hypothetical protein